MKFTQRTLCLTAIFSVAVFLTVLTKESNHHYKKGQDHNCSLCSWQLSSSQATVTPVVPFFFCPLLFALLFVFKSPIFSFVSISPSGRSPPQILL